MKYTLILMASKTVLSYAMALIRLNLHKHKHTAQQQLIHTLPKAFIMQPSLHM